MKAIIGKKIGMTQIFTEDGFAIPVTVIAAGPCYVLQKKTQAVEGYEAVQLGYGSVKEKNVSKPRMGQFKKAGTGPLQKLMEFRVDSADKYEVGQEIKCDIFAAGEIVDVKGISKGRGFQGVIKRHGFRGGSASHGQSNKQRAPGSIGSQQPQRVSKGTLMAGRMGGRRVTVQRIKVVDVIPEKNLLLLQGAVPGNRNALVSIYETIKKSRAELRAGK